MPTRFHLAGETLSRLGVLEWFKLSAGPHPDHGRLHVPYAGWRFARPGPEKLRTVEEAVRTTPTQVDWRVEASRRNWLLAPARILGDGPNPAASPAFDERVAEAARDQEFCARALEDLDGIMRTLGELAAARESSHRD
ncbi:hypothetical protein EAO71_23375 [Streptomyces sp. ms191]|uniref:hypothetical protein n=1 Tax=Streptomyces sp. ms191 TaxID=1827978 RepID=UPI0011CE4B7B|nr:hypothetical protein [Streptomyces sp. ms191]TXS22467.1 hypothetical protein EAO71_23375 [Streptomyces sp. ms191]